MTPNPSSGRLVPKGPPAKLIEVNFRGSYEGMEKWSTGKFVNVTPPAQLVEFRFGEPGKESNGVGLGKFVNVTPPARLVEFSFAPPIALTVTLLPDANAETVLTKLKSLIEAVDQYDRTLGGEGVQLDSARTQLQPGTLKLVLVPPGDSAVSERLRSHLTTLKDDSKALAGVQSLELIMAV